MSNNSEKLEPLNDPVVIVAQVAYQYLVNYLSKVDLQQFKTYIAPDVVKAKLQRFVDHQLETNTKKELILTAVVVVLLIVLLGGWLKDLFKKIGSLSIADIMSNVPILKQQLQKEVEKARTEFKTTLEVVDPKFYSKMPQKGW